MPTIPKKDLLPEGLNYESDIKKFEKNSCSTSLPKGNVAKLFMVQVTITRALPAFETPESREWTGCNDFDLFI